MYFNENIFAVIYFEINIFIFIFDRQVNADERDVGRMVQKHLKLLNIESENVEEDERCHTLT